MSWMNVVGSAAGSPDVAGAIRIDRTVRMDTTKDRAFSSSAHCTPRPKISAASGGPMTNDMLFSTSSFAAAVVRCEASTRVPSSAKLDGFAKVEQVVAALTIA